jgi:transcriptional regulator with XRE-family HTH domain
MPTMYSRLTSVVKDAASSKLYTSAMNKMGERIRTMRESKALTQEGLSDQVGVTRAAIAQWEAADHVDIKLQPFLKLLDVLSVDAHWLVYGLHNKSRLNTKNAENGG